MADEPVELDEETADDEPLESEDAADGEETDADGDAGEDGEGSSEPAEADAGLSQDGSEVEATPPKKRPISEVIRDSKQRAKAAEAKAAAAESKAAEALRRAEEAERRATERRAQETEEAERQRVELMSESERLDHYRKKDKDEYDKKYNAVQFQVWDSTDRMEFRQLLRDEPALAQVKDETETEFERLKAAGRPVSREILANQFLARLYRKQALKAPAKQRKAAEAGVRAQTVKPPQTRSNVTAERRQRGAKEDTAEARGKRLEGVIL